MTKLREKNRLIPKIRKITNFMGLLILAVILLVITGCNGKSENITSELPCYSKMVITKSGRRSWVLFNITVGETTKKELVILMGTPDSVDSLTNVNNLISFDIYLYGRTETRPLLNFLIIENKVEGIFIDEQVSLYDIVTLYGKPDLVGWIPEWEQIGPPADLVVRRLAWPRCGAIVDASYFHQSLGLSSLYFTPMTMAEFNNSYLSGWIVDKNPSEGNDWIFNLLHPTIRDPYDWDALSKPPLSDTPFGVTP
jgi:hypothetical protein